MKKKSTFTYSFSEKTLFVLSYIYYKLTVFHDCKSGSSIIYRAEVMWLLNQLLGTKFKLNKNSTNDFVTKFGKFTVPGDVLSTITVSPAFERRDINYLLKNIQVMVDKKQKVLFVDIGANFGLYSIIIGNAFKRKKVDIIAFEPNTTYLTHPTFSLLKKNIEQNHIKNIRAIKKGIGSKNTIKKNKIGITTVTLDSVVKPSVLKKYDMVVMKIDVDDFVLDVLKGVEKCVSTSGEALLLVEDFVDKKAINVLERKYIFDKKLTSYNSFWIKK